MLHYGDYFTFSGNFLHAESNRLQLPGDVGIIRSDVLPSKEHVVCLRFEYKIDGSALISFKVFVNNVENTTLSVNNTDEMHVTVGDDNVVIEEVGSDENIWKNLQHEVTSTSDFQVTLFMLSCLNLYINLKRTPF